MNFISVTPGVRVSVGDDSVFLPTTRIQNLIKLLQDSCRSDESSSVPVEDLVMTPDGPQSFSVLQQESIASALAEGFMSKEEVRDAL